MSGFRSEVFVACSGCGRAGGGYITDDRSQMTENRLPFIFCPLYLPESIVMMTFAAYSLDMTLEPISKIVDKGSGQGVSRIENGAYKEYVSISIRGTTQPCALRRIFEIGSSLPTSFSIFD